MLLVRAERRHTKLEDIAEQALKKTRLTHRLDRPVFLAANRRILKRARLGPMIWFARVDSRCGHDHSPINTSTGLQTEK